MRSAAFARLLSIALPVCALLSSCSMVDAGDSSVTAMTTVSELIVSNTTDDRIYFVAMGEEIATRADVATHLNLDWSVKSNGRKNVPLAQIEGAKRDKKAVIYWWRAVKVDGKLVPGSVNTLSVSLLLDQGTGGSTVI